MSSEPQARRVTTLELFFDLVFVFTITQLASVVFEEPTLRSVVEVALMLALIWWMYDGYAWLTNAVEAETTERRLLLLGGMAGYFLLALATPDAFGSSGLAFGLCYLAIVAVHTFLFSRAASRSVVDAIVRLSPFNVVSALLVVAGGALGGTAQYVLWGAAIALEWVTPWISGLEGFEIDTGHFVERHGLVLLIAIGESVVVVGVAGAALSVDAGLAVIVLLGLALSASIWWLYFGTGDDARAEHALERLVGVARAKAVLFSYFFAYLPMLLGLVLIAAAEHAALEHPFDCDDVALRRRARLRRCPRSRREEPLPPCASHRARGAGAPPRGRRHRHGPARRPRLAGSADRRTRRDHRSHGPGRSRYGYGLQRIEAPTAAAASTAPSAARIQVISVGRFCFATSFGSFEKTSRS